MGSHYADKKKKGAVPRSNTVSRPSVSRHSLYDYSMFPGHGKRSQKKPDLPPVLPLYRDRFKNSSPDTGLQVSPPESAREREAEAAADRAMKAPLQERMEQEGASSVPPGAESISMDAETERKVRSLPGKGSPLSDETLSFMESRMGADFRDVRVHTGSQAEELAGGLQAKAFTYGKEVVFNRGQYAPGTREGKHLLAHELTHTRQQAGGAERVHRKERETPKKRLTPSMIQAYWESFANLAPHEIEPAQQILRSWEQEGYDVSELYTQTMALRGKKLGHPGPHNLPPSPETKQFGQMLNQGLENNPVENQLAYLLNLHNPHVYETWCHAASMYIVLREAGADVEANFVEFYVKHVKHFHNGTPEIYGSNANVMNNPEIVKEYGVERVPLLHKKQLSRTLHFLSLFLSPHSPSRAAMISRVASPRQDSSRTRGAE